MTEIVAADIGGTHARFARATLDGRGRPTLDRIHRYRTGDYAGLEACWRAFVADAGQPLPGKLSIAVAGAIRGEIVRLPNSSWSLHRPSLAAELGLAEVRLINDFEAVAQAVAWLAPEQLKLMFGPDDPLPRNGTVTVIGPGTGLGVAAILFDGGKAHILPTEGGHMGFAPVDACESEVLDLLRGKYGRVSVERVVSGPGLNHLHAALLQRAGRPAEPIADRVLWAAALDGTDAIARQALELLARAYGTIAGDLALAHGARQVVLSGGLTARMRTFLVHDSGFHDRFMAKGRYQSLMRTIPVRFADHPEIGLYGAAAAWVNDAIERQGHDPETSVPFTQAKLSSG